MCRMCNLTKKLGKNKDGDTAGLHRVLHRLLLGWHGQQYVTGRLRASLQTYSSEEHCITTRCLLQLGRHFCNWGIGDGFVIRPICITETHRGLR